MATPLPAGLPQILAAPVAPRQGDTGPKNADSETQGPGFAQTLEQRKEMKASAPAAEPRRAEAKAPAKSESQTPAKESADTRPSTDPAAEDASKASLAGDPAAVAALVLAAVAAAQTSSAPQKSPDPNAAMPGTPATGTAAPGLAIALAALARAAEGKDAGRPATPEPIADTAADPSASSATDSGFRGALAEAELPESLPAATAPTEVDAATAKISTPTAAPVAEVAPRATESEPGEKTPVSQSPSLESLPANAASVLSQAAHAHSRHEAPALQLTITPPPGHPQWAEAVGNRVTWMVGQNEGSADLVLTPPQLGRVEVSVTVSGDLTTAQFVAATPAARDVLEQALPRLREVLAEAGIMLADAQVSTSDQRGASADGREQAPRRQQAHGLPVTDLRSTPPAWLRRGEGLVDTFA